MSLPSLKARSIDPLIRQANGYNRLSEIDKTYVQYLDGQKEMMRKAYKATILVRPAVAKLVEKRYEDIQKEWQVAIKRDRNPEHMARRIKEAEGYAAAHRFDHIHEADDRDVAALFKRVGKLATDQS